MYTQNIIIYSNMIHLIQILTKNVVNSTVINTKIPNIICLTYFIMFYINVYEL